MKSIFKVLHYFASKQNHELQYKPLIILDNKRLRYAILTGKIPEEKPNKSHPPVFLSSFNYYQIYCGFLVKNSLEKI
ncbi:hypothetical protein Xen7305DRAFT_00022790 [Xenococcus sp. PCC 7305]|nr:hypothetical protein Xen7305DRAFT_00022790 [Xenococcus sp. PCC 7305]